MLSQQQIQKYDKSTWAKRWASLKGRFQRVQEEAEHSLEKAGMGATSFGGFAALYYLRRRLQHSGKRVTFDKAGKADAFFWPGLAAGVLGVSPLFGEAGKYVTVLGASAMSAGSVDYIDELAKKHAKA